MVSRRAVVRSRHSLTIEDLERFLPMINHCMSYQGGLKGDGHLSYPEMESAIGALITGQLFGFRVLELVHSRRTLIKYAKLLGIRSYKDYCPKVGPYAHRHKLYRALSGVSNWYQNRYLPGRTADHATVDVCDAT